MTKQFRELLTNDKDNCQVLVTGLPYDKNASVGKGASLAPDKLRELSSHLPPSTMDGEDISACKIYDYGNIEVAQKNCEEYFERVEKQVDSTLSNKHLNLFLGGDHSVAIPLCKSFKKFAQTHHKKVGIIHIDAHPDICDIYEGSPNSHACPIRRAIDEGINTEDILLIGIRGFELQEIEYFQKHPEIELFKASYINENGINTLIKRIKEKFDDNYFIYLSYDIDANDPAYAPGTGTPEAFGLNSIMVLNIIKEIFKNTDVRMMDIVEIAPPLDVNDVTSWLALKTLYEIFNIIKNKEYK